MNLIETATRWRHGTLAVFILLALLGVMSLLNLPLELQPGGDRPQISITTPYPGAAPAIAQQPAHFRNNHDYTSWKVQEPRSPRCCHELRFSPALRLS